MLAYLHTQSQTQTHQSTFCSIRGIRAIGKYRDKARFQNLLQRVEFERVEMSLYSESMQSVSHSVSQSMQCKALASKDLPYHRPHPIMPFIYIRKANRASYIARLKKLQHVCTHACIHTWSRGWMGLGSIGRRGER